MKKMLLLVLAGVLAMYAANAQETCPLIPKPAQAKLSSGAFILSKETVIQLQGKSLYSQGKYLQQQLLNLYGAMLPIVTKPGKHTILLREDKNAGNGEGYTLNISPGAVSIMAGDTAGIINGIASFIQLSVFGTFSDRQLMISCWQIKDQPKYAWRGVLLDESRFFFGKSKVKSVLDWMAFYKLNRFHWHLTDAPGWRIEIKQYPLLTTVGGIGNHNNSKAPAAFYTQEDIREIVAYAAQRGITVIPEIDMPGHASAANRAYPEFDGGGSEKFPQFTFNPGKEGTYQYLANILKEVRKLFPSGIIHLGGDEVTFGNAGWDKDPGVINLKTKYGLTDRKQVEDYFIQRMADTVIKLRSKVMAWDEAASASLSPASTIITWWRHDKPETLNMALDKGYKVVLCPRIPFYLDFVQDSSHKIGRRWAGKFNDLQTVYNFDANSLPGVSAHASQVLGVQACVWTETVQNPERLDFLLFPRIAAVAETAWSTDKDFTDFEKRLQRHLDFYDRDNLYYYDARKPQRHKESGVTSSYLD